MQVEVTRVVSVQSSELSPQTCKNSWPSQVKFLTDTIHQVFFSTLTSYNVKAYAALLTTGG